MTKIKLFAALFLLLGVTIQAQTAWKIDEAHSKVQFSVSHMVISDVTGQFRKFDGSITSAGDDFSKGRVEMTMHVASINTDNEKRDEHLKSADFFDAQNYPEIKFVGKSLKKIKGNKYKLTGNFTMKGVTRPITLDVIYGGVIKDPYGRVRSGFKVTGTINRFDYNLKWNNMLETGGAVVGKDVNLVCNIELVRE
ncbi:MAG: YceI family protein [Bacteroidota bacterium]